MTLHLRIGFMPLVDCALVVLAKDEGFAEAEGLNLELVREVSWSNLRDKLNVRLFDAAHMLGPAAIAATLGVGGVRAPMAVPLALNLDGAAITVTLRRYEELARLAEGDMADTTVSARALAALVARRKASGLPPLTLAAVFGFSSHTYLICEWLAKAGLVLGDGYPLRGRAAAADGRGPAQRPRRRLLRGGALECRGGGGRRRRDGPYQYRSAARLPRQGAGLAGRRSRSAARLRVQKLTAAILRASDWACDPANIPRFAAHLSAPDRLALPVEILEPVLHFNLLQGAGRPPRQVERFIRFDREALRPVPDHAAWILAGMERAGQIVQTPEMLEQARSVFRPAAFPGDTA